MFVVVDCVFVVVAEVGRVLLLSFVLVLVVRDCGRVCSRLLLLFVVVVVVFGYPCGCRCDCSLCVIILVVDVADVCCCLCLF